MTIRPATVGDIAAVQAIAAASPTAPQWTQDQFDDVLSPHPGSAVQRVFLVAENHCRVVGFAVVSALTTVYPVEAELESIAVDPVCQRRGIGRGLLRSVFSWCGVTGVATLRLEVRASNSTALALYEGAGFKREGTRSGYYASPAEDAICMVCSTFAVETFPST